MSQGIDRFLGDSLGRTIIKLAIISFVVGIILSALNITPWEVWDSIREFFVKLYNLGFDAIWSIGRYFALGAAIVVPIFLVLRLLFSERYHFFFSCLSFLFHGKAFSLSLFPNIQHIVRSFLPSSFVGWGVSFNGQGGGRMADGQTFDTTMNVLNGKKKMNEPKKLY